VYLAIQLLSCKYAINSCLSCLISQISLIRGDGQLGACACMVSVINKVGLCSICK